MGLDVYVGTLGRYYSGQWETIIQQWGHTSGIRVSLPRQKVRSPDTDERRLAITAWRASIALRIDGAEHGPRLVWPLGHWRRLVGKQGAGQPADSLDWDESETAPYFTDKPDWDGYVGALLLAAYAEHPELERPEDLPEEVDQDPAWRASAVAGFRHSRYRQILQPTLWLPGDFKVPVATKDLTGQQAYAGSSVALLTQLREVNEQCLRGTPRQLARWRRAGAEPGDTFLKQARFGLAVFLDLAEKAVAHHLPMKLDY
ncbi:MAG: hypothetical protein ACREOS_06895 [Candidatus Dormibacteraceae bacterium]